MKESLLINTKRIVLAFIRSIPDKLKGVDYAREVVWDDSLIDEHSRYSRSTQKLKRAVNEYLKGKDISNDSIIDIGCGKGYMLSYFAKHKFGGGNFKQVAGIDFSQQLCNIAKRNMKKENIECSIICHDAATYGGYSEYSYFYMFNPMKGELLRNTVKQIAMSVKANPRSIHIIYCNPWSSDILIDEGFKIEEKIRDYAIVFTFDF